jgi:PPOX class probable F420-dependent enzyme
VSSAVVLTPGQRAFLSAARRATLATIAPDGRPRLVPICFVLDPHADPPVLYSPIDDKPKRSTDPLALARVRDIVARPDVTILVDRWSEDWAALAWLRCSGRAEVVAAESRAEVAVRADVAVRPNVAAAIAMLRAKYPPYMRHDLEHRAMIRIHLERATSWGQMPEA